MKKTFFSHDKNFYAALFPLLIIISLQNLISYSVNMADNIMLGAYSQNALSGAALVNQIFFLIQQAAVVIGDGLVVISSQYWGQKRMEPIRQITGMVLKGVRYPIFIKASISVAISRLRLVSIMTTPLAPLLP